MKKLHKKLSAKYPWYDNWHKHPHHPVLHWIIFLVVIGIIVLFWSSNIHSLFAANERLENNRDAQLMPSLRIHSGKKIGVAPDRILVQFSATTNESEKNAILRRHNLTEQSELSEIGVKILALPPGSNPARIAQGLMRNEKGKIEFAEADEIISPSFTPNDPAYPNAWHHQKVNSPAAWDSASGNGIIIAIADTGVDPIHPDLLSNLIPGWNVIDNTSDTRDVYGHGTAVAGVAAAVGNNLIQGIGVAYSAKIMPIRVSDLNGNASYSSIARAITYAADRGARVVNVSYHACGSNTIDSAARYLGRKNGILVIAAGNSGGDTACRKNSNIIDVSATDNFDLITAWSNYGADIGVSAPGLALYSTANGGGAMYWSGTSFSAPLVSGVLALIMSANPALTAADASQVLFDSAIDLGIPGWDKHYGWGRVDAARAISLAQTATSSSQTPNQRKK